MLKLSLVIGVFQNGGLSFIFDDHLVDKWLHQAVQERPIGMEPGHQSVQAGSLVVSQQLVFLQPGQEEQMTGHARIPDLVVAHLVSAQHRQSLVQLLAQAIGQLAETDAQIFWTFDRLFWRHVCPVQQLVDVFAQLDCVVVMTGVDGVHSAVKHGLELLLAFIWERIDGSVKLRI